MKIWEYKNYEDYVEKMIEKNGLYIRNRFKWGRHNGNMIIAGKCK